MISVKNFETLIQQGRTFEDYFRYVDQQAAEQPVTAAPGSMENDNDERRQYGSAIINDISGTGENEENEGSEYNEQ